MNNIYFVVLKWCFEEETSDLKDENMHLIPCANADIAIHLFHKIARNKIYWNEYENPTNVYLYEGNLVEHCNVGINGYRDNDNYLAAEFDIAKHMKR